MRRQHYGLWQARASGVAEAEIARALDALLTRAEHGPAEAGVRIAARTARPPVEPQDTGAAST